MKAVGERVVFLDFDGVIRVMKDDGSGLSVDRSEFCPERIERVRKCCELLDARLVISSDWRNFGNRDEIEGYLGRLAMRLHEDWATPILGKRWNEVARWLAKHPEVEEYAVLEDFRAHFEGCPVAMERRVVWCNNRFGFVPELTGRLLELFRP